MDLGAARCAAHPDAPATVACFRCGAFACAACAKAPSVLCAACVARLPAPRAASGWAEVPRPPGRVLATALSVGGLYTVLAALLALRALGPQGLVPALVLLALALLVLALGLVRLVRFFRGLSGRRALRAALRSMREQRYVEASAALEEVLRAHRLDSETRALTSYLFAANIASAGEIERARPILEALVPSGWRHVGSGTLLRGQGQVVLAVVRALDGDLEGARAARAAARFGLVRRWTYSPAYGDAVLAARSGDLGAALGHAAAARRFAARFSLAALDRSAALVEAFAREGLGEGDAAVEIALAPARASPAGAHQGMGARWPAMRDFLARRLPAEGAAGTRVSAASGRGSPLTPESALR